MRNFADALVRKIDEVNNPTVIGLDPKLDYIPDHIKHYAEQLFPEEATKATAKAIWLFNKEIIDHTYDIVPALKLQFAYYEMYGVDAIKTMLGISPKVHLVSPKTIERSEGKAVRVVDKRKLH